MKVTIIGGGASGMAAALSAAENGHQVLLLERQARVGRKLLSTGNGRCNLSNLNAVCGLGHYHGKHPDFCQPALEQFDVSRTLEWFRSIGLMTLQEPSGRIYPISNMAGSVLDVLRYALEKYAIDLQTSQTVVSVKKEKKGFSVVTETSSCPCDCIILAAGGCAGSKLGGVMDGYHIAESLGHHRTSLFPSLVQLRTDPTYPRALKGVKADADVKILRDRQMLARNTGEVLFTEYGISGPAVFEISRAAATAGSGLKASLDFLPDLDATQTMLWLEAQQALLSSHEAQALLTGSVHSRLGQVIVKSAGFTSQPASSMTKQDLKTIASRVHHFELPITGVCGFDQAQVTAGGLQTDEFDPLTLQSRLVPGFYACGEVLDIDGDCGGYNLQWAWSSGHLAGQLT